VRLEDVLVKSVPAGVAASAVAHLACSSTLLQKDFSTRPTTWSGGYGAFDEVTAEGTFNVPGRKDFRLHAVTWDMRHIRACLVPDKTYVFSARVKLTKFGGSGLTT
jgi:hypothetical protein